MSCRPQPALCAFSNAGANGKFKYINVDDSKKLRNAIYADVQKLDELKKYGSSQSASVNDLKNTWCYIRLGIQVHKFRKNQLVVINALSKYRMIFERYAKTADRLKGVS